jgi:hypothetical protein
VEFDTPSTKYIFITTGIAFLAALAYLGFNVYKYESRYENEIIERRLACTTLQPKFGSLFVVRSGFYEGQIFKAKRASDQYVTGDIIEKELLGTSVLAENITIECPMLKVFKIE